MNAVEMRGIVKQYPLVRAIDGADFTVEQGEIHSLLGENGAGKSTLMKILYGMTTPTAGEVRVFGKPVAITRPAQAIALGIGMVHQHFMLTPVMTVAENVVIGSEPVRGVFFDRKKAEALVRKADKQRELYYHSYTGLEWGRPDGFDLYFDSHEQNREEIIQEIMSAYAALD